MEDCLTERGKVMEWCAFYRQSKLNYQMNALLAVLETDGEKMLQAVLQELGLTSSFDLVKDAAKK